MRAVNQEIYLLLIFAFFAITLSSLGCNPEIIINKIPTYKECSEEPAPLYFPGEMMNGRVAGLKNCLPFLASVTAIFSEENPKSIGLDIRTFTDSNHTYIPKEFIGISAQLNDIGTWPLSKDSTLNLDYQNYKTVDDLGEIEDSFKLDKSYQYNRIAITYINLADKHVKGWFEVRYVLSSLTPSGVNPDTILFMDCNFDAFAP